MLDEHTFGVTESPSPSRLARWYRHNRPALVAAAWFWLAFLALALITLFTGWASLGVTLSLEYLVSLGAGWLAALLLRREGRAEARYTRQGMYAGFTLALTTLLVVLVVAIWVGLGSFGTLLPLMLPYFISLPLSIGGCGLAGLIGARLAQFWFERKSRP